MAKELPYFKFEPNQWENGNIQICSREDKGLFLDLCSMYWSRLGDVPFKLAVQKLCGGNAGAFELLLSESIFEVADNMICIDFLNEQLEEFENTSKTNSQNAKEGWKKRRKQKDLPFEQSEKDATALKSQSENDVIREEKRREEKKTEEKKTESAIGFLKAKYPSRFETDFMMKHSRQIKDRNQFFELFNNKCDVETLEFTGRILFARLNSFSINWIRNQSKSTTGKSPTDISL